MSDLPKTEIEKWKDELGPQFRKMVVASALSMVLVPFFLFLTAKATNTWDQVVAWWNTPARLEELFDIVDDLRLPRRMFELSPLSGPKRGFCVAGEPCDFNLRIRRYAQALSCDVVGEDFEYFYRTPFDNALYPADRLSGFPRNVETQWVNLSFRFSTPTQVLDDAEFCMEAAYVNCPGQKSSEPIHQPPECLDLTFVENNASRDTP